MSEKTFADKIRAEAQKRGAHLVELLRQAENDDLRALLADANRKSLEDFYAEMTTEQRERWFVLLTLIDPNYELSSYTLVDSINAAFLMLYFAATDENGAQS